MLTAKLTKSVFKQVRMLLGALLGALYSLVIFVPSLSAFTTILGRFMVSLIIVISTFGFKRMSAFVKNVLCFYFSNLIFFGVILAIWLTLKPRGVFINNDAVYFNISAKILLLLALISYVLSSLVVKLYNHTISKKEIYSLTIIKDDKKTHLYAFLDSGNRLVEPFSSYPVIIVDSSKINFEAERVIPYSTVGGEGFLNAFKPDCVIISNGKSTLECKDVYVASSNIESKEFSAILNPMLLNI